MTEVVACCDVVESSSVGNSVSANPNTAENSNAAQYVDANGVKHVWSADSQQWVATQDDHAVDASAPADNNMTFVNGRWQCTDANGAVLAFDDSKQEWVPLESLAQQPETAVESDDDIREGEDDFAYQLRLEEKQKRKNQAPPQTTQSASTFTSEDGTAYEWDAEKRAWVPKIDEDFLALYQAQYGLNPLDTSSLEKEVTAAATSAVNQQKPQLSAAELKAQKRKEKRKLEAEQQKRVWFDMEESHNRNVYVSGLPPDVTMKDFEEVMSKCGIIEKELDGDKLKLKLYRDEAGNIKGDGRCCYMKKESVDLALQILDDYQIRPGVKLHVESAQFSLKGQYDPTKRKKLNAKQKKKLKEAQEKMLDWRPDKLKGERPKHDSTVVVKNLFSVDEFVGNATLIFDLQELLKAECAKYGLIKKVVVYDNNPDGAATVTFAEPEMADDCLTMMDHRVLRERKIRAERWDGKTKYKVEETEEQRQQRLQNWRKELETD